MVRQVKNPNQTARKQYIEFPGNSNVGRHKILFCREHGYHFSDDESMDEIVNYFVNKLGYVLVGADKGSVASKVEVEEKIKKPTTTKTKK